MTHARITINRKVEMDQDIDEWEAKPPSMFADAIKPGAAPQPWLKSVAVALSDAVSNQRSIKINVVSKGIGWTMKVEYQ